jgi:branched-chain amino acid aminotransferase
MKRSDILVWKVSLIGQDGCIKPLDINLGLRTFNQITETLPDGAYTTLRTYQGDKVLHLESHIQRLENTSEIVGDPVRIERAKLRGAIRHVIRTSPSEGDLRLRLIMDLEQEQGVFYIMAQALNVPPETAYTEGVEVITCGLKRQHPLAKLTRFVAHADQVQEDLPQGVNEALMLDENGGLLEGLSSNFFAIKAGEIWTAPESVLAGTTRGLVLDLLGELNIPVNYRPVVVHEISRLEEAFITSASRGILPVVKIDKSAIGLGEPGRITRRLMVIFLERILEEVEEI